MTAPSNVIVYRYAEAKLEDMHDGLPTFFFFTCIVDFVIGALYVKVKKKKWEKEIKTVAFFLYRYYKGKTEVVFVVLFVRPPLPGLREIG